MSFISQPIVERGVAITGQLFFKKMRTHMKIKYLIIASILTAGTYFVSAQAKPNTVHHPRISGIERLLEHQEKIGLNDQQIEQLEILDSNLRHKRREMRIKKRHIKLEIKKLTQDGTLNEKQIEHFATTLGQLESDRAQLRLTTRIQVNNILSSEQKSAIAEKRKNLRQRIQAQRQPQ